MCSQEVYNHAHTHRPNHTLVGILPNHHPTPHSHTHTHTHRDTAGPMHKAAGGDAECTGYAYAAPYYP